MKFDVLIVVLSIKLKYAQMFTSASDDVNCDKNTLVNATLRIRHVMQDLNDDAGDAILPRCCQTWPDKDTRRQGAPDRNTSLIGQTSGWGGWSRRVIRCENLKPVMLRILA